MRNIFETISQLVFIVLAFVVLSFISLGVSPDWTRITTSAYWIEVTVRLILVMITFNIIYYLDRKNRANNQKSRFYIAYATNKIRVKRLEEQKLYDELEKAVEQENQNILEVECNRLLKKLCTRIDYNDVMKEVDGILQSEKELIDLFRVAPKKEKKFIKLVRKIRSGEITVNQLNSKMFLRDKEINAKNKNEYDYNEVVYEIERNVERGLIFVLTSMFAAVVTYSFVMVNFWSTFITNVLILFGAIVAGFFSSLKSIKKKTAIYELRNSFLKKYLDIKEEYEPETK